MSNPLAALRENGKVLMAIFAVLLMVAFLVEGTFLQWTGGRGDSRDPVVVSFNGSEIKESQFVALRRADVAAAEYMRIIAQKAMEAKRSPRDFPVINPAQDEQMLFNKVLLAQKAYQQGLTLSDANIDDLLVEMSDGAVTPSELAKIRAKLLLGFNNLISEQQLYIQLRTNILAQELAVLMDGAQSTSQVSITPAKGWDYFRRKNREVKLEVLPLKVDDFVAQVTDEPTSSQLNDLFTKFKDRAPDPNTADPGFAKPHRIAFGYIRLDNQKFIDAAKKNITEEQLKAEYARRVDAGEFVTPELPSAENEAKDKPATEPKPEAEKKPESTPANEKPEEKPASEEKPAEKKDEAGKPSEPAPATEPKVEEKKGTGDNTATASAVLQATEATTDKPAEKKDAAATKSDGEPKAETAAGDSKPAETKPDEAAAKQPDVPAAKPAPKTRVKTFDEVRDDILTSLARKPAEDAKQEGVKALRTALQKVADAEKAYETAVKTKAAQLPPKPDVNAALAEVIKTYGFTLQSLPLLTRFELADEELGQSFRFMQGQRFDLADFIYLVPIGLYEPDQNIGNLPGIDFIYWKEAEERQAERTFDEARDDVVKAWKMQKAFELARAEAKSLADKVGEKSLREAFPEGVKNAGAIQETEFFSWLSTGSLPFGMAPLQVSRVPQVPYAGQEFMETMHRLPVKGVDVAPNQSHDRVYVMRVVEERPTEDLLRQRFMNQGLNDPAIVQQFRREQNLSTRGWFEDVQKTMNVVWYRAPQAVEQ